MRIIYVSITEMAPTPEKPFQFKVYVSRGFSAREYVTGWKNAAVIAELSRKNGFAQSSITRKDGRINAEFRL